MDPVLPIVVGNEDSVICPEFDFQLTKPLDWSGLVVTASPLKNYSVSLGEPSKTGPNLTSGHPRPKL
jgi:hypothetical protein